MPTSQHKDQTDREYFASVAAAYQSDAAWSYDNVMRVLQRGDLLTARMLQGALAKDARHARDYLFAAIEAR